jgi:hypothetical protein
MRRRIAFDLSRAPAHRPRRWRMTAGARAAVAALAVACGDESADDTVTLGLDTAQADTDFGAPAADRVTNSYVAALDEEQAIGVVLLDTEDPDDAAKPVVMYVYDRDDVAILAGEIDAKGTATLDPAKGNGLDVDVEVHLGSTRHAAEPVSAPMSAPTGSCSPKAANGAAFALRRSLTAPAATLHGSRPDDGSHPQAERPTVTDASAKARMRTVPNIAATAVAARLPDLCVGRHRPTSSRSRSPRPKAVHLGRCGEGPMAQALAGGLVGWKLSGREAARSGSVAPAPPGISRDSSRSRRHAVDRPRAPRSPTVRGR